MNALYNLNKSQNNMYHNKVLKCKFCTFVRYFNSEMCIFFQEHLNIFIV